LTLPWNNARGLPHIFLVTVFCRPFGMCTLPFSGHGLCPLKVQYFKPYLAASAQLISSLSLVFPAASCSSYPCPACSLDILVHMTSLHFCFSLSTQISTFKSQTKVQFPLLLLVLSPLTDNCHPPIGYLTAPF
jgi:hypothetical protein